jgi:MFS family permease
MGVYSSVQFLGAFFGAAVGGALMQYVGHNAVFIFAIVLLFIWLLVVSGMKPLAVVRTKMYHLEAMTQAEGVALQQKFAGLQGVREALVVSAECMACLKVDMKGFDEVAVLRLVTSAANDPVQGEKSA